MISSALSSTRRMFLVSSGRATALPPAEYHRLSGVPERKTTDSGRLSKRVSLP